MTLATLGPIQWPLPLFFNGIGGISLSATTHRHGSICTVPKAGTLDVVGIRTGTVTTAADLRIRIETVNASGDPSGTLVAAGADGSVASPAANTWYDVTIVTPPTLTAGQLIAIVVDCPSGSPNLQIARITGQSGQIPYTDLFATSWAKSNNLPLGALKISGSWVTTPDFVPFTTLTSVDFDVGSSPDERGNVFTCPIDCEINGAWFSGTGSSAGAHIVRVYDASNTVLTSTTVGAGVNAGFNSPGRFIGLPPVNLEAGSLYRVVVRPTSAAVVGVRRMVFPSTDHAAAFANGIFRSTERTNDGSWTDTNTSVESIGLIVSKVHETGGGAIGRYKAKVDGELVDIL